MHMQISIDLHHLCDDMKEDSKKALIHRMKYNNPMFDPVVVEKVSKSMRGNQNARKFHRQSVGESRKVRKGVQGLEETGQGEENEETPA